MDYNDLSDDILKGLNSISIEFKNKLLEYVLEYVEKGKLTYTDRIATIENDIISILKDSGYLESIEPFFKNFQLILESIAKTYPKISEMSQVLSESKSAQFIIDNTTELLKNTGLKENIINPIAKELRKMILTGETYKNVKATIDNLLTGEKPIIVNYVKQFSLDAFAQFDGALQFEIKEKYNPKSFYYIGGKIETSRPLCSHIKDKFGNNPISVSELEKELNQYCPKGEPSDEVIYINEKKRKKGDGIIKGTTINNFEINRGGYNCEHKVRWIL